MLEGKHIRKRLDFTIKMHDRIHQKEDIDPSDICFFDECMVDMNAGANK